MSSLLPMGGCPRTARLSVDQQPDYCVTTRLTFPMWVRVQLIRLDCWRQLPLGQNAADSPLAQTRINLNHWHCLGVEVACDAGTHRMTGIRVARDPNVDRRRHPDGAAAADRLARACGHPSRAAVLPRVDRLADQFGVIDTVP
jgi:hypothetical protein